MKFRTQYDRISSIAPSGDRYQNVYKMKLNKITGLKELTLTSERTDLVEFINSFAESADIHTIIAKFQNGDLSVLNQKNPVYADFSNFPTNIADAYNFILEQQNAFNDLPVETREKFDFSFDKYISTAGSIDWLKNLGYVKEKEAEIPKESEEI